MNKKTREAAGVEIGELAQLEIVPVEAEPEPEPQVPTDLRKALTANPEVRAIWSDSNQTCGCSSSSWAINSTTL
jgi:hypothetical protein